MDKEICMFDNVSPSQIESYLENPEGIKHLEIDEEDSPVSIDAMVSIQNEKLMFVSSVKIGTLAGLLETEDPRLALEQRRQRRPNKKRIPKMAEYLHGTPWAYSAITVALSGAFQFTSMTRKSGSKSRLGILKIPRGFKTRAVIIDGQHRFLSIRSALGLEPDYTRYALPYEKQLILAQENIAVIFYAFSDDKKGINWSQQYFHDLNCLGVQTSRSLGVKFDKRTPINLLTVRIAERALPFVGRTEMEEKQCGVKNPNLFTLSALKNANKYLLSEVTDENVTEKYDIALDFWNSVGEVFTEWSELQGFEVRDKYVHGYGVILSSLGLLGKYILNEFPDNYKIYLKRLKGLNWYRWQQNENGVVRTTEDGKRIGNPFWNGFAMNGSSIQNTTTNIRHTTILLKKKMGCSLSEEENTAYKSVTSEL